MKQSQRQRGKARFIWSTISFVWGGALAPWAAITGLGRSGEWVGKAWLPLGGSPGLKKHHKSALPHCMNMGTSLTLPTPQFSCLY